jgi:hypothetical protein
MIFLYPAINDLNTGKKFILAVCIVQAVFFIQVAPLSIIK